MKIIIDETIIREFWENHPDLWKQHSYWACHVPEISEWPLSLITSLINFAHTKISFP